MSSKIYFEKYTDTPSDRLTTDDYLYWNGYENMECYDFKTELLEYFDGGFNYVVSGGDLFKVGRTDKPKSRIVGLRGDFEKAGVEIENEYWSKFNGNWIKNERCIIEFCNLNNYEKWAGKEYFKGDCSDVIRFAESLDAPPPKLKQVPKYNPFISIFGCKHCGLELSKYLHELSDTEALNTVAKKVLNKGLNCECEIDYYKQANHRLMLTNKRSYVESVRNSIEEIIQGQKELQLAGAQ